MSKNDELKNEFYSSMAEALRMLEEDCEPLKLEVFVTYSQMVNADKEGSLNPSDIMLHAMMEWDLA